MSSLRKRAARLASLAFLGLCAAPAWASEPGIDHQGRECFLRGSYPVVDASIDSPDRIKTAKVYFRAEQYVDFYWVEMQVMEGRFVGVLPQPSPDTHRILYYIEALDFEFYGVRDTGHDPEIRSACELPDDAAYVPGDDPRIIVGATSSSGPSLPPGFQAAGIAGFMSATGISSGVGGGVGAGTAVVIGASVAGAVGGAAVAVGGNSSETSSEAPDRRPVPAFTTTIAVGTGATTTTTVVGTTTTSPGATTTLPPGSTTTVAAGGSSTTTTAGSTTTTTAGSTTTTSVPTTTTTSVPTTTTTSASPVTACFVYVTKLNSCIHRWSSACSSGPITSYDWIVDTTGELPAGPLNFSLTGTTLDVDWNPIGSCSGAPLITVQLTVTDGGVGSDTTSQSGFKIDQRSPDEAPKSQTRLTSRLAVASSDPADGVVRLSPTRLEPVNTTRSFEHAFMARTGRNVIEAFLTSSPGGPVTWEFDFSSELEVVAGSLRPSVGDVIVRSDRRLVFRLAGRSGERVRFTYRVEP